MGLWASMEHKIHLAQNLGGLVDFEPSRVRNSLHSCGRRGLQQNKNQSGTDLQDCLEPGLVPVPSCACISLQNLRPTPGQARPGVSFCLSIRRS